MIDITVNKNITIRNAMKLLVVPVKVTSDN